MPSCGTIIVRPEFDPGNVSVSCGVGTEEITEGGTVSIPATVSNENDAEASYTLTFEVGSGIREQVSGSVAANSSEQRSITVEIPTTGEYPVAVSVSATRA